MAQKIHAARFDALPNSSARSGRHRARPRKRPAELQVIGAGCGRTGTTSLSMALERLGFGPCHSMAAVAKMVRERPWARALEEPERADWRGLLSGFGCSVDFPASVAYQWLLASFPDAKVILTVRDPHDWARSVATTIWSEYSAERSALLAPFRSAARRLGRAYRAHFFEDSDGGVMSGELRDTRALATRFEAWNARVSAAVPPERLLVFRASDGWAPLCAFLGVPVPRTPFPRANDSGAHTDRMLAIWRRAVAIEALYLALAIGAVAAAATRRGRTEAALAVSLALLLSAVGFLQPD